MDQLRAMKVYARVVDEGGFARAARALDMAPPVVTRMVAELEAHLGARLLNRTTRRIALTEVGERYLEKVRLILLGVEESEALAGEATKVPRGHLRVLCPPAVAVHQLAKHMPRFHLDYPQITLELSSPGPVETVSDDFDVTIFASLAGTRAGACAAAMAHVPHHAVGWHAVAAAPAGTHAGLPGLFADDLRR